MIFELLRGLVGFQDLQLSAIFLNEGILSGKVRSLDVPVEILDERRLSFSQILKASRKILRDKNLDIIHSHRYKENLLAFLASRFAGGVHLIATQHGMPEVIQRTLHMKISTKSRMNFQLLSKCFDKVVAVSSNLATNLEKQYGFRASRLSVIHNGISIPKNNKRRSKQTHFTIGSSGRLFPVKDYPLMVETAKILSERSSNMRFELAGDGPELQNVERIVRKHGLEKNFMLRGFVENTHRFYQGLDLYINTSLHEGIPISVLEAMAHGLPVVAPKVGGFPEIITEGLDGFMVRTRNPGDFANRCLTIYQDETLRKEMGLAARHRVLTEFSSERMAEEYRHLYEEIINRNKGITA